MLVSKVKLTHYFLTLILFTLSFLLLRLAFNHDSNSSLLGHSLLRSHFNVSLGFLFSPHSLLFGGVVSLITGVVLSFSLAYMGLRYNYQEFLILLLLFVLSILIVIFLNDLLTVIVG